MSALDLAAATRKGAPMLWVYDFDEWSCCLLWSAVEGADIYAVQMRDVNAEGETGVPQWKTLADALTGTTVRKKKLAAERRYEFRVAAMLDNVKRKSTFTLGTNQNKDTKIAGPYSAPARLEARTQAAMAPPTVFESDGSSATVRWAGGAGGPFALQYALAGDGDALKHNGGGPWTLAAASIAGDTARKKNLRPGRRYSWRVKPSSAPNALWSRASPPTLVPLPHPFMARVFGKALEDNRGGARPADVALAGRLVVVVASASWCDACRALEPALRAAYAALRDEGKPVEVVWLSEENDAAAHAKTRSAMPWLAVPYGAPEREDALEHFKCTQIPKIVVLNSRGRVVEADAGADLAGDFDAWLAKAQEMA